MAEKLRKNVTPSSVAVSAEKPAYDSEDIKRINEVIDNARPTWFALLGVLVFCGITLLGVRDIDFFAANQSTQLPLVNVSVPVTYFFLAGAVLATATYVYLHLYLEWLWEALGSAKPRYENDPLAEHIKPWQIAEWGLRHRDWLRGKIAGTPLPDDERASSRRDLSTISSLMSIIFVWLFGPLVLFYFWWRSLPAHIWYLSIATGTLFVVTAWIGWHSARRADTLLARRDLDRDWSTIPLWQSCKIPRPSPAKKAPTSGPGDAASPVDTADAAKAPAIVRLRFGAVAIAFLGVCLVSLAGTSSALCRVERKDWLTAKANDALATLCSGVGLLPSWLVAKANLAETRMVELPRDWKDRKEAERDFRAEWAKREGLPYGDPFDAVEARDWEAEFQDAYKRRTANPPGPVSAAPTPPPMEEEFRLEWAKAHGLEPQETFKPQKARDVEPEFQAAWKARRKTYLDTLLKPSLDGRNLRYAALSQTFLAGIQARNARLEGADLSFAQMEGASLFGAQMQDADLSFAQMEGANLGDAQMQGANLSYAQMQGADLSFAQMQGANLLYAQMQGANLSYAQMQGADLSFAQMQGANLLYAQMQGANLSFAQMQGASLFGAQMQGTAEDNLDLTGANLSASRWTYTALRFADISTVSMAELEGFETTFGDASVILPADHARPCQWAREPLSDEQYFGRWRGWLEASSGRSFFFVPQLMQYPAIPPPPGCGPQPSPRDPG